MEIVKRENGCPICSSTLWLIPTMSYVVAKIVGVTYHREWIWWVAIPTMALIWVLINWKIKK
jgi:hypothetical protein